MSLDDTLERPASAPLRDPTTNWITIATFPRMAAMNNYPVALKRDGTIYVFSGGDGGNAVMTSWTSGVTWNEPGIGDWPARRALSAALHDGKFYIVGGFSPGQGFGDTLVSEDGHSFTQLGTLPAPWGVRWAHTLLSAGDKLLMIAGVSGPDYSNEVWALRSDGAWAKIAHGQFTKRAWAAGAVLGEKLLVIGGWNDTDGAFAETLISTDGGVTWTTHPAAFSPRHSAAAVTVGDTVYLVGGCIGRPGTTFYPEVWATQDGIAWTRVDDTFAPYQRTFAAVPLAGRIGVIGSSADIIALDPPGGLPAGARWSVAASDPNIALQAHSPIVSASDTLTFTFGGDGANAVARSTDGGGSWTPLTADYPPRNYPSGTTDGNGLWLVGGQGKSDWLISNSGDHWTPRGDGAGWGPRFGHSVVSLGGVLYLMAGIKSDRPQGDVWKLSATLSQWDLLKADAFTARTNCAYASLGTNIVLMGGNTDSGPLAEVLISPDGLTWQTRTPPWTGRWGAVATVLGDTLYLIGGKDAADRVLSEVWTTRDANAWVQIPDLPVAIDQPAAGATSSQVLVLGGQVGGQPNPLVYAYDPSVGWTEIAESQDAGFLNYPAMARLGETTYALDGSPQTPVVASAYERVWAPVASANLPFRQKPAVTTHGGKLWVTGGDRGPGRATQDVFYSADGVSWTAAPTPMWMPRRQHALVDFDGVLYLIGGSTDLGGITSDVYYLDDATYHWGQERANPFPGRCAAAAVAFKGNIWLLGGRNAAGPIAEALRRNPDYTWTTFAVPWAARHSLAVGVLSGRLYVSLGQGAGGPLTDTWVSDDGQSWTQVAGPPGPALRDNTGFLAHGDALLAVGGTGGDGQPNFSVRRFVPPA